MIAKVIVDISASKVDKVFDYVADDDIKKGQRVIVPFGKRNIEGFVIDTAESSDLDPNLLKPITNVIDSVPLITPAQMHIAEFLKKHMHIGYADSFKLFLPAVFRNGKVKPIFEAELILTNELQAKEMLSTTRSNAKKIISLLQYLIEHGGAKRTYLNQKFGASAVKKIIDAKIVEVKQLEKRRLPSVQNLKSDSVKVILTDTQQHVLESIMDENAKCKKFLLYGVTGSGKTEVYMNVIEQTINDGKTAIMLVPEISLTPQVMMNFKARFGENIALLHSGLSVGERFDEWRRIITGDAKIVIGARSALFAPLKNIGAIIIDEEHDNSYISESNPRYNTIEVASSLQDFTGAKLVLGSATPSLDSYHKAIIGEYTLLEMPERINKKNLPPIKIVDMKNEILSGNNKIFSREMEIALKECIAKHNQAILFLNRRGYSSYIMCNDCGWRATCPSCDVSLVYHKAENLLKCHYCDKRFTVPSVCPICGSKFIKHGATGTQKVVDEIHKFLPDVKVLRMDNDTTSTKNAHEQILTQFRNKEAQILVGTQMIAKGHDFPDVTFVGILDADLSLHQSSFTAPEKTFQLITQVAGRAGRKDKAGEIILQTYMPRHYVYKMASVYDYISFYKREINLREVTKFPPFSRIYRILISSDNEESARIYTMEVARKIKLYSEERKSTLEKNDFYYIGAMRSPVKKINNKYRYQVILRTRIENVDEITEKIYNILDEQKDKNVLAFVEVNPNNMS